MLNGLKRRGGMVRKRARIVWYVGCGIVLAVSLLVLLIGHGGKSGKPVAHPNALEVAWSARVPERALDTADLAPALSDTMLMIPQGRWQESRGRMLSIVDTRDGRLLSTLKSSEDKFAPLGFSDGVAFAVDGKLGLHAYDPANGRELWHKTAFPITHQSSDAGGASILPDSGLVIETARHGFMGLEPRTGAVRWRMPALERCEKAAPDGDPYEVATTSKHLILLSKCTGVAAKIETVNLDDGDIDWKKTLGRWKKSATLNVGRNTFSVTLDSESRLFTESGKEVRQRQPDPQSFPLPMGEAHGVTYFNFGDLYAVQTDTGKTLWTRSRPEHMYSSDAISLGSEVIVGEVESSNPALDGTYGSDMTRTSVGDARSQGPGASNLTDFAGKQSFRVPWPVAGTFVGVSGKLLIVRSEEEEATRYTALRPSRRASDAEKPVTLGGAKRTDWPDACGLLSSKFLSILGRDYIKVPLASSRTVLGTRLPHPSVCRFVTKSGADSDIFSVTVRWVAPNAKAAHIYATSAVPWGCEPAAQNRCLTAEATKPQRGVYLYTKRTGLALTPAANATVASGRFVVGVSTGTNEARTKALVRRVALHLSHYADPDRTP
ncbi:PQQ-binding-like beta-propeller repeat protein [Streptomyces sp. NPDC056002]|uniref:outer membrane protein assembly factor BamB family protein n=1 Tax=Streptomyces sp. NPDC056002 TaxID=3345675 RepID=UPI0035D84330